MLATDPARLARRSCATVMSLAFRPGKTVLVMPGTGIVPCPRVTVGRVVCVFPLLTDFELVRSISKPPWKACCPLFQLTVSENWVNGLMVCRGEDTFKPA